MIIKLNEEKEVKNRMLCNGVRIIKKNNKYELQIRLNSPELCYPWVDQLTTDKLGYARREAYELIGIL